MAFSKVNRLKIGFVFKLIVWCIVYEFKNLVFTIVKLKKLQKPKYILTVITVKILSDVIFIVIIIIFNLYLIFFWDRTKQLNVCMYV